MGKGKNKFWKNKKIRCQCPHCMPMNVNWNNFYFIFKQLRWNKKNQEIDEKHHCIPIINFDVIELPLNINIFPNKFTRFVFARDRSIFLPVPIKIPKCKNKCHPNVRTYIFTSRLYQSCDLGKRLTRRGWEDACTP